MPFRRAPAQVDGQKLVVHLADGGPDAVLLLHGLAADHRELLPLGQELLRRGYTVAAPDHRGHGESEGLRGQATPERHVADAAAVAEMLNESGSRIHAAVGHSLGCLTAIRAVATGSIQPRTLVLVAPPVGIWDSTKAWEKPTYKALVALARAMGPAADRVRVPYRVRPRHIVTSRAAAKRAAAMGLPMASLPLSCAPALIGWDGRADAARVTCLVTIVLARDDRVVDHARSRQLGKRLAGPVREIVVPGGHSCFLDDPAPEAIRAAADAVDASRR